MEGRRVIWLGIRRIETLDLLMIKLRRYRRYFSYPIVLLALLLASPTMARTSA